ncbi:DUF4352 domain-containing protein [Kribbella solani]|uniref:DUF4352 domain-containing protein n=1 Tax=Kribbella solani TaxID=236067 RepID=UPI0029A40719|nr:DUF4352 domain-containing protein [Kribbella solani]MDX2972776.1 DUF4352 domain-containing protein [Kribbella solani]MDX3003404.1 DUF4352 domain-containing protein [Kribbella solani]
MSALITSAAVAGLLAGCVAPKTATKQEAARSAAPGTASSTDRTAACKAALVANGIKLFSDRPAECQSLNEAEFGQASDQAMAVIMSSVGTPSEESPLPEETTSPPDDPGVAKIGATQWFTYEDGLKVQVAKATRYKIGEYASGGTPGESGIIVTVTIRNGTKKTADLSMTTVKLAYGANGDQAEQVFDSEHGVGSGFEGSATPGRSRTAKFAFAVPKGRQRLDIEVEPGFLDYESVHFEGSAK